MVEIDGQINFKIPKSKFQKRILIYVWWDWLSNMLAVQVGVCILCPRGGRALRRASALRVNLLWERAQNRASARPWSASRVAELWWRGHRAGSELVSQPS
jgi:hypothetical protein